MNEILTKIRLSLLEELVDKMGDILTKNQPPYIQEQLVEANNAYIDAYNKAVDMYPTSEEVEK